MLKSSKQTSLVSIIIPTYNQAKLLRLALKSIIYQTYNNWEAIVINNFSTDNTLEIVNEFEDKRIKIFNFKNNGIIASSRNYGILLSKGDYIAFLDSDDIWFKNKLSKTLNIIEKGYDLVFHHEIWKWNDGLKKKVKYGPEKSINFLNLLFRGNKLSTSSIIIKKNLLYKVRLFNEDRKIVGNEDYDLWMRISLENSLKVKMINEFLGYYILHEGNTSGKIFKQLKSELKVIWINFKRIENKKFYHYLLLFKRNIKSFLGTLIKINSFLHRRIILLIK